MNRPTSRNPWPIAIVTFFAIAILALVGFVAWAVQQREDLVSSDYYEREVRYQSQLDSLNRSQTLAQQTRVTFEPLAQHIVIALPPDQMTGATGSVHLYRPSDARLDRHVPLALDANGVQRLDGRPLSGGLWKVRIKWKAAGQEYFIDQSVVVTAG